MVELVRLRGEADVRAGTARARCRDRAARLPVEDRRERQPRPFPGQRRQEVVGAGVLEMIEIVPNQNGAVALDYVPPRMFRKEADAIADTVGPQNIYTIEGDTLYLAPAAVTGIKAKWFEKFTALSGDSDTDWIVTNAPQVYLDGCLMLACAYTQDEREAMFRQKFAASIKALNLNDQRKRSSGSFKVARPRSVV